MRRSDLAMVVVGSVVGLVVIAVGLVAVDGTAARVGMLLPLAVLAGGLLWSIDGAREPETVDRRGPTTSSAPVLVGDPTAVDAPTILPPSPEPEPESISEADRLEAARTFDLDEFLLDERPDRIQCSECGRYRDLKRVDRDRVLCRTCGATREVTDVQPDTRVRLFFEDDPAPSDAPTVATTGPPVAPTPSTHPQGG